mgnify:CR=1 FL=1
MTPQEFAQKIRAKYPGSYDNISDAELTNRVIAKYPVYKSQVTIPRGTTRQELATGVVKSVAEQERNLGKFGQEIAQQTAGRVIEFLTGKPKEQIGSPLFEGETPEGLEAKTPTEKVGKFIGDVASFAIPGGAVSKAVSGASLPLRVGAEALTGGALSKLQGATNKEAAITGAISGAVPVISEGIKLLRKPTRSFFSFTSGVPEEAIKEAQTGRQAITEGTKMSVGEIRNKAVDALKNPQTGLFKQLNQEFGTVLDEVNQSYNKTLQASVKDIADDFVKQATDQLRYRGANEAADRLATLDTNNIKSISGLLPAANEQLGNLKNYPAVKEAVTNWSKTANNIYKAQQTLTRGPEIKTKVLNSFVNTLREYNIGVSSAGEVPTGIFSKSKIIKPGEQTNINQALQTISDWTDFSPKGVQALSERVGALRNFESAGQNIKSAVLGKLYNKIADSDRGLISQLYPDLIPIRKQYETTVKVLDEISSVLGTKAKTPVQAQQAISRLSNLFKEDKEGYLNAIKQLSERSGVDILGLLSGAEFKKILPDFVRGLGGGATVSVGASLINPYLILLAPLFSPRAVGSIVKKTSLIEKTAERAFRAVPAVSSALFNE